MISTQTQPAGWPLQDAVAALHGCGPRCEKQNGPPPTKWRHMHGVGAGWVLPRKAFEFRVSEMAFPAF